MGKILDTNNVELTNAAVRMRTQGLTCHQIAEKLNASGYTTVNGKRICNAAVSHFLIKAGHRTNKRKTSYKKTKAVLIDAPAPKNKKEVTSQHDFLLEAITAPYLTKDQKLDIIKALVK